MPMVWRFTLTAVVALSFLAGTADGFIVGAFKRVEKDFLSLTRRVTARHILLPDEEVARVLKQKIRDECIDKDLWVIDAFEEAAKKYSRDETTNFRGGLIGELAPQGKELNGIERKRTECNVMELDQYRLALAWC